MAQRYSLFRHRYTPHFTSFELKLKCKLDTMTWSQPVVHGKPPLERCGHTATIVGDRLIVLAGNDSTGEFNDINILMLGM